MSEMTQSEAFELLGSLIGKTLSVNGVHGQELKLIAEAYVRMKETLVKDIKGLTGCITRAMPIPDDGMTVIIVTDDSGDINEHSARVIKQAFRSEKPIPILIMSADTDLNLVEGTRIVGQMFEQLPLLRSALFVRELALLKEAARQLRTEMETDPGPLIQEISVVLGENGVAC